MPWQPVAFRGEDVLGPRSVHCLVVLFDNEKYMRYDKDKGMTARDVAAALGFGTVQFKNKYASICHALNKLTERELVDVKLVTRGVVRWKRKDGKTIQQRRKVCQWRLTAKGKREAKLLVAPVHALLKTKLGLGVIRGSLL